MDWKTWHDDYDRAESWMARRLRVVQERIRIALDGCPPGPIQAISLCAGQARDLLAVLPEHARRVDVRARLVELDERNTAVAADVARSAGLDQVEIVTGDAALIDQYCGMVPADLVLICGVFGNVTDEGIEQTISTCPQLCKTGGTVVWTRHRGVPDLVPQICDWFEDRGFEREWLSEPDAGFGVGVHRFAGQRHPMVPGTRMFTFVGYPALRKHNGVGGSLRQVPAAIRTVVRWSAGNFDRPVGNGL